ncbi:hypothetical protein RND81_04G009800 [Saponaria officinalis]|uniref:Uncharacterized protein n=1 Tax=Saponaria officinalis TaxID=3572 RepID=A0AAW1LI57_SAPOF
MEYDEVLNLMKRDLELISRLYMERVTRLKNKAQAQANATSSGDDIDISYSQAFNDPKFIRELDEFMNKLEEANNAVHEFPSFELVDKRGNEIIRNVNVPNTRISSMIQYQRRKLGTLSKKNPEAKKQKN